MSGPDNVTTPLLGFYIKSQEVQEPSFTVTNNWAVLRNGVASLWYNDVRCQIVAQIKSEHQVISVVALNQRWTTSPARTVDEDPVRTHTTQAQRTFPSSEGETPAISARVLTQAVEPPDWLVWNICNYLIIRSSKPRVISFFSYFPVFEREPQFALTYPPVATGFTTLKLQRVENAPSAENPADWSSPIISRGGDLQAVRDAAGKLIFKIRAGFSA